MSPSNFKPSLAIAVIAVLTAAVPLAASAHGTCKPANAVKAVHKVVYKTRPKPVKTVRVRAATASSCDCARRTVVRYVREVPPPPIHRVVVYRTHAPEPVYVHAPYVAEAPVVYGRYAVHRSYGRYEHHRRDVAYDGRWRHYDWRDEGRPY